MKKTYSIIITDDHPMVSIGLKTLLNEQDDLTVSHTAQSGFDLLQLLENETPDLIVLDISMPDMDGVETARKIRAKYPQQKIVCISTFYQASLYATLKAIPVQGFIPKLIDTKTLLDGIYKLLNNEIVYIEQKEEKPETKHLILTEITNKLGRREIEIMKLIKLGKLNKEIADELEIAQSTVETHRKNICKKLGLTTFNSLYKFAVENF